MSTPPNSQPGCTVEGSEKLPAETGGADAVCGAIQGAISSALGADAAARTSVVVRVRSAYSVVAEVTAPDGQRLPELETTIADRQLNRRAIGSLAGEIARQLASRR